MTDYKKYINALKKCAKEHENDSASFGYIKVSDLCRDTANLLEELEQKLKTDVFDKVKAEIEEEYGGYDICEWFENYDYEENDISEYEKIGNVSDILAIIDKYKAESVR